MARTVGSLMMGASTGWVNGIDAMEVVIVAMEKEDERCVVGLLCRLCSSWRGRG
jgi:hypothetical protein